MAWTERPQSREKVYESVKALSEKMGAPPTFQEIVDDTGLSLGSVTHHIERLVRDGKLRRLEGGKARGLIIVKDDQT